MDIFAHTLWTTAIYYKKYRRRKQLLLLSALFGVLSDLVSFVPVFIYSFISGTHFFDLIGSGQWTVRYASMSYNLTHSAVIFIIVVVLVALWRGRGRRIWWPMWGWGLHIFIDIFTHKNFYETPFLFPLSGYTFSHGVSWAHPVFMLINYSALAVVYLVWFLVIRKREI